MYKAHRVDSLIIIRRCTKLQLCATFITNGYCFITSFKERSDITKTKIKTSAFRAFELGSSFAINILAAYFCSVWISNNHIGLLLSCLRLPSGVKLKKLSIGTNRSSNLLNIKSVKPIVITWASHLLSIRSESKTHKRQQNAFLIIFPVAETFFAGMAIRRRGMAKHIVRYTFAIANVWVFKMETK